ncbi:MAG: tetratricopeptide repeat protein [Bacteroidetes bacterium]|nr:tetratricopeptide repeat protein [Bacteroidota bacterium]
MKYYFVFTIFVFCSTLSFGQQISTYSDWVNAAKTDIRLLPMYGQEKKSKSQIKADNELIKQILKEHRTHHEGSEHLIKLGFHYLFKGDLKTAMYRFNQSWLLDSTNANTFWGLGGVYFYLSAYDESLKMYKLGLELDSLNTNLLTDIGAIYLTMYNADNTKNELLKEAILYLKKSYQLNPNYSSTVYKMIIASLYDGDCEMAKKYFDECSKLERNPITEEFKNNFRTKCH